VYLSVVFPAYNEEKRIVPTLEEAVEWLDKNVGRAGGPQVSGNRGNRRHQARHAKDGKAVGYEILIVNDGSTDRTVDVVLDFCRENKLHDVLRVVSLERNRGKGGGVTHGFRHVRGEYVLFADADGASKFSDVAKLIEGCEEVVDGSHRGVAIGSRAHLVGSEAVVKVRRYTFIPISYLSFQKADRMGFELSCCSAPPCETSSCARSTSCS
jgi:dolichyl-phosphate beta-glucosyltransferase